MNSKRIRQLNAYQYQRGPVVYWMNREERVNDNWSLLFAQKLAQEKKVPLLVVFNLVINFLGGGLRQFAFKIEGLQAIEKALMLKNIPFFLIVSQKEEESANDIFDFLKKYDVGVLVTDFYPLRVPEQWKDKLLKKIAIPFYEVDARNIIPCWLASGKQEFGAYTLRPKIHKLLPEFLDDFDPVQKQKIEFPKVPSIDWEKIKREADVDRSVAPLVWIKSGEKAATKVLDDFLEARFKKYADQRNDPTKKALSNLSPYLHYGQISAQRVALEVHKNFVDDKNSETLLEELIVRRELADNFCFYNKNYDNFEGFPHWAQQTLNEHRNDPREYLYSLREFEQAKTHDELWNASQLEMVKTGKMHGYMRMYWAKKILEWTCRPEEAQKIAIYLNDKYELDGRETNGYVGIAWSIGGVHDRPWFSRSIFGKVRYMSYNGCKSKFDVKKYIEEIQKL